MPKKKKKPVGGVLEGFFCLFVGWLVGWLVACLEWGGGRLFLGGLKGTVMTKYIRQSTIQ